MFEILPTELKLRIFNHFNAGELTRIARVNKVWNTLANNENLWETELKLKDGVKQIKLSDIFKQQIQQALASDGLQSQNELKVNLFPDDEVKNNKEIVNWEEALKRGQQLADRLKPLIPDFKTTFYSHEADHRTADFPKLNLFQIGFSSSCVQLLVELIKEDALSNYSPNKGFRKPYLGK